jgi:hypothetical protein
MKMSSFHIAITFSSYENSYSWDVVAPSATALTKAEDVSPFALDKKQIVDPAVFGISQAELQAYLLLQKSYLVSGEPEEEKPVAVAYLTLFDKIDSLLDPIVQEAAKDTERWAAIFAKLREEQEAEERANAEEVEAMLEAKWEEEGPWMEIDRRTH